MADSSCLSCFKEGKVFEVILSSGTNMTPVGVVRKGNILRFKLFQGRSMEELRKGGNAILQPVNDVELLVRLALNLPANFRRGRLEGIDFIRGEPWILGRVEVRLSYLEDELGRSKILDCVFHPITCSLRIKDVRPVSRADLYLLEMGVDVTRLLEAHKRKRVEIAHELRVRILENYRRYKRLGGDSEVADYVLSLVSDTKV